MDTSQESIGYRPYGFSAVLPRGSTHPDLLSGRPDRRGTAAPFVTDQIPDMMMQLAPAQLPVPATL